MSFLKEKYNILVIGKTGVGKSSFVNYFLGDKVAKTGTGSPVTERGFHEHPFELDGFPVTLYDSWGLEADKYMEWMENFSGELNERGVDKPATEWFHSVFYCISAGSHRVEDADIAIVKQLQAEKYPVSVILTKGDMINEAQEEEMKSAIWRGLGKVNVITMSSGGKTRGGVVEPFGLDEIRQAAKDDFFASIAMRIPDHLRAILDKGLADWDKAMENEIKEVDSFNEDEILGKMESASKKQTLTIKSDLRYSLVQALQAYDKIMISMDISTKDIQFAKDKGFWSILDKMGKVVNFVFRIVAGKEMNAFALRDMVAKNRKEFKDEMLDQIAKVENKLIATRNRVRNHA